MSEVETPEPVEENAPAEEQEAGETYDGGDVPEATPEETSDEE